MVGQQDIGAGEQAGPLEYVATALAGGKFLIQRCGACAGHVFPPRRHCPRCRQDSLLFVEPSGRGTVYAATIISRREERGGDYNVVLVDLEEGVRVMSRVEDVAPEDLRIGLPVSAGVTQGVNGPLLVFFAGEG